MKRGDAIAGKSPLHTFCSGASFSSDFNTRRAALAKQKSYVFIVQIKARGNYLIKFQRRGPPFTRPGLCPSRFYPTPKESGRAAFSARENKTNPTEE